MVLRFSISAMIYIFDHPSPSHQFPQSQIAGSRTYVGHCAVGWPNHTVSFYWFLSGLEWIPNLEVFFTKTFDILPEIIMEYQT